LNKSIPKVTVIIPHFNGEVILRRCLLSLKQTVYSDYEILVVDNGSSDNSIKMVRTNFPDVHIATSKTNLGFAGGCNLGIITSKSPYVVLLNNDTEVTPHWLDRMVNVMDTDPAVGAVQPKMLSFHNRKRFDYCGAAGGEIDIFGYPFARGRIFESLEIDNGQYDTSPAQIFWATGAATLLRRSALEKVGLLEETFFAHMEEIDLDWRLQWAGYKIVVVPSAIVYHQTGATLNKTQFPKMVLNHRNNLLMILRNHTFGTLLWLLPFRLILETITIIVSPFTGEPKRALAILKGFWGVLTCWKSIVRVRKIVQSIRVISEEVMLHRMYRGSIALAYFLKGIRKASDII